MNADLALEELRRQMSVLLDNPASEPTADMPARRARISMSDVQRRLEVPDIPGYRMYWFKDENVPRAIDAYYEFVKDWELKVPHNSIGSSEGSGNTDLGTNVSIIAGQNEEGRPVRLNLMKLPLQYYREDQKKIELRNAAIMEAIFGEEAKMFDEAGNVTSMDPLAYRKKALFNRPARKIERKKGPLSGGVAERVEKLERMLASKGFGIGS
jgi:hypothetical protein